MGRRPYSPNSQHDRLVYRIRILPQQLDRAYRRVEQLEREAQALGLTDIIRSKDK